MKGARRFLTVWIVSVLAIGFLVAAFNWLIDPYDVFGTPRLPGLSLIKPAAKNHALLAKTYQVARAHPVTVVIGSSPVHIGIDASSDEWPADMRPVYNFGIPGGYATSTSLRTLQEAVAAGGVKNAVVFLDFQNFFQAEQPATELTEDERRFRVTPAGQPNPHRPAQAARDMFLSLATLGAFIDSVKTVASQRIGSSLNLAPDGSSNEADFVNAARSDGMHVIFEQKNDFEFERATRLARNMSGWNGALPNLGIIDAMIAYARDQHVKLTLVLAPHHADTLELYWRTGMWPRIEQLKTEIAALADARDPHVTFWDFMDYSPFATETVPPAGDVRTATTWFWEPTHFKKALGYVMIGQVAARSGPAFGAVLTPADVPVRNAEVRAQRQALVCGPNRSDAMFTQSTKRLGNGCGAMEIPVPQRDRS